tara:strand:- start:7755 stop:9815 length:2061 start_codon:yes stop_codon:yes gene_type:complete
VAGQESLGTAVLQLTVDDSALRQGIADAKKFIGKELGQAFSGGTGGGQRRGGVDDRLQATRVITRRLGDELQKLADRGVKVKSQFDQLNKAVTAAEKGQIETARARNKGVADFIREEKRRTNLTESTLQRPIRGSARDIGSPIGSARGARLGGQKEDIDALFKAQKRRYSLDQQIRSLEVAGVNTAKLRASLGAVTTAQSSRQFGLAKKLGDQLSLDLRKERDRLKVRRDAKRISEAEIAEGRRIGRLNVSPVRGRVAIPESPAAIKDRQDRRRRFRRAVLSDLGGRISSGLVGGAFPLLFGQGPGAAIGGGTFGFLGGSKFGFGASLVGTVLGQAFDQGIEKAKVLASALDNPVQNFQALADAGLISSKSLKNTIQALIETGRTAEAAALIQGDLASRQLDPETIKELEKNTQALTNRWNDLSLTLATVAAGPLSDIIASFNKLLGGTVDRGNFENLEQEIADVIASARRQTAAERNTGRITELDREILESQFSSKTPRDKIRTAELQKQKLALQKINALAAVGDADKIRRNKIINDFKLKELRIEQDIKRAREDQKKAAQELIQLRLQNLKFLPESQKQSLLREQIGPAVREARLQGIPLRSISEAKEFIDFRREEERLRNEAGSQLVNSNSQLSGTLQSTADVVRVLTASMDNLQKKNWEVHVTIPGQNGAMAGLEAVNSLAS